MSEEAVTALVFDAAPAQQGAAQFEVAGQKIITANQGVVSATTRTVDAQANMERALAKLTRQIDPAAAAQANLEAGQRLLERAFQRGAITAQDQAQRLATLETRYGSAEAAARRAAAAQDAFNEALGIFSRMPDDTAKRAADIAAYGTELDRLRAKYTPLGAAQQAFRQQMVEIAEAERGGALRTAEAAAARDKAKDAFRDQIRTIQGYTGAHVEAAKAVGLTKRELGLLAPQIADVGVTLAMGMNPLMVLIQQGPQMADAVGGVARSFTLLRTAALAAAPYVAAVVGIGAPILAFNVVEGRLAELRATLRGVTEDYRKTAVEVEAASRRIAEADIGVSAAEASQVQAILRRAAPAGSTFDFEALTRQAADFAKVLGVDIAQAADQMAQGLRDPAALVKQLAERNLPGMTEALRLTAERLVQAGERGDAAALVLGRINDAVRGQAADVPPLTAAWRQLSGAMGSLWDDITKGLAGPGATLLSWMADVVNAVRRVRDTSSAGANQGLVPEYDPQGNPTGQYVADPSVAGRMDEVMRTYTRRVAELEAGNRPGAINSLGYAGLYQFGSAAAQSAGVYTPAAGENVRANGWQGTFNIPGFEHVRTLRDFLSTPDAQTAVMELHTATIDRAIAALGPLAQGLDQNGLRYVAHAGGPTGMARWVQSRGAYDPQDANGTSLSSAYQRMTSQAAFSGATSGAAVPVTVVGGPAAAPSVDTMAQLLDRATKIARGEEGRPLPTQSVDTQRGVIAANITTLQRAAASGQATPEQMEAYTRGAEAQRAAYEGTLTAAERMTRAERERTGVLSQLDPVQRELAEAVQEYRDAQRAAGRDASPGDEARIVEERLRRLRAEYSAVTDAAARQADSAQRVASAYNVGTEAGRRAEAQERAMEAVRRSGITGDAAKAQAVADLTEEYLRNARADAERQQAQRNNQSRDDLAYAEREAQLIGATAEARERELAVFKARQEAARNGIAGSTEAAEQERLALALVTVRQNSEQLRNSWNELSGFFDRTFDKIGTAITEAFAQGKISAVDFKNVVKAVMSEVIQAVMRLAVINPILNNLFGGSRGTLGGMMSVAGGGGLSGLSGGGGQVPIQDANGNITGYIGQASSASSLYRNLGGMNPGNYISGVTPINTGLGGIGMGGVDNFLNTPIFSEVSAGAAGPMPSGATVGAEMGGITYGGAALGAAGVAGGLYGIYSGIQKGGVGGGFGVAGGAATAGLSAAAMAGMAVPIYGWIAAAVLTIIGALLPGQKASGKGQEFRADLFGNTEANGLTGDRFSGENANAARNAVNGIVDLARQVGDKLGGVRFGGEIAVGVTSSRGSGPGDLYLDVAGRKGQFTNDEEGSKQLADQAGKFIMDAFRSVAQGDYAAILNSGASDSLENLQKNLDWYESVYKSFGETTVAANAFEQSLKAVRDQYQVVINKAGELGLSYDKIVAKRDEEIAALQKQRDAQVAVLHETVAMRDALASSQPAYEQLAKLSEISRWRQWEAEIADLTKQLTDLGETSGEVASQVEILRRAQGADYWRNFATSMEQLDRGVITATLRATGRGAQADLLDFDAAAKAQVETLRNSLAQWGLDADTVAKKIRETEEALGYQRVEIVKRMAEEQNAAIIAAGQPLRTWLDAQKTASGPGGVSNTTALAEAQKQFARDLTMARGGDQDALSRITGTADRLLELASKQFASGPEYQAMRSWILSSIGNLPQALDYDRLQLAELQKISAALGAVPRFASGGIVGGGVPGRDSVTAMLMPGEGVLNLRAMEQLGGDRFAALNRGEDFVRPVPVVVGAPARAGGGLGELLAELRAMRGELSQVKQELQDLRQERASATERQTRVIAAVGEETAQRGAETVQLLREQADTARLSSSAPLQRKAG